jgi:hypothetical protein
MQLTGIREENGTEVLMVDVDARYRAEVCYVSDFNQFFVAEDEHGRFIIDKTNNYVQSSVSEDEVLNFAISAYHEYMQTRYQMEQTDDLYQKTDIEEDELEL